MRTHVREERLELVRAASKVASSFAIWKNVDAALAGVGDIDAIGARSDWPAIRDAFEDWARTRGLEFVVACRHMPGALVLLARSPHEHALVELDVRDRPAFRGCPLFEASMLQELQIDHPDGYRRLRQGAEGFVLFLNNEMTRGGRPTRKRADAKPWRQLVSGDPDGAVAAARLLGFGANVGIRLSEVATAGDWPRAAAMHLEMVAMLRALRSPRFLVSRLVFRTVSPRRCPVIASRGGRHITMEFQTWLAEVRRAHPGQVKAKSRGRAQKKPTDVGLVVCVAGPDGVGKSALCDRLQQALLTRVEVGRFHHRPPIRHRSHSTRVVDAPHASDPYGAILSRAKLLYLAVAFSVAWMLRIRPIVQRGGVVLLERGWLDLLVDPRRYRLGSGARLVRALGRVVPHPDLTVVLNDAPARIQARKPELGVREIERQLDAWRLLAKDTNLSVIAVEKDPNTTAAIVTTAIAEHRTAGRPATPYSRVVAKSLGSPCAGGGQPYALVAAGGRARWLLPRGVGRQGAYSLGLYRPATPWHALGAFGLEIGQRLGGMPWPLHRIDDQTGLAPLIAADMGLRRVELAALLPTDPSRSSRLVLCVLDQRRPVAVAKVAEAGSPDLERELRVLEALEGATPTFIVPPRALAFLSHDGLDILVVTRVPVRGRTSRPLGRPEQLALIEMMGLLDRLAAVLPSREGEVASSSLVPSHGDFSGWNSAPFSDDKLALWDWEWAHMGEPLEDWFHWETQRLVHFGVGSVDGLVKSALEPGRSLRALCARLEIGLDSARSGLMTSLRHGLERLAPDANGPERGLREDALRLIEEAE